VAAFMRAGGYSMWVVLFVTIAALVAAIAFVARADLRKLALVRALTSAGVFAIVGGLSSNLAAVFYFAAHMDREGGPADRVVLQGLGESMGPAILGFTILALSWILVAVGTRRVQDRESP